MGDNKIEDAVCCTANNTMELSLSNLPNSNKQNKIKIKKSSNIKMNKIFDILPDLEHSIAFRSIIDKNHIFPKSFENDDWDECQKKFNQKSEEDKKNYNKVHVIKLSEGIIVIDFDAHGDKKKLKLEDIYSKFSFLKDSPYTRGIGGKGFHFYVKNNNYAQYCKATNTNNDSGFDIDFLTDSVHELYNVENVVGDCIKELSNSEIENIYPEIVNKNIRGFIENKTNIDCSEKIFDFIEEEILKHIANIKTKYCDNFNDWVKICAGLWNTYGDKKLIHEFSKKSKKYNYSEVEKYSFCGLSQITMGTLKYYSKISNSEKYWEINNEYNEFCISENDFSDSTLLLNKLIPQLKYNLIWSEKKWFTCVEGIWKEIDSPINKIQKLLRLGYVNSDIKLTLKMKEDDANVKDIQNDKTILLKARSKYDNQSNTTYIINQLKDHLHDEDFLNRLDQLPNKLAFKNGILDLVTKQFSKGINPEDYVSRVIDFDYKIEDIDENKYDFIKLQIKKICNNNQEHMDYILSYIGASLCGTPDKLQKVCFFIGQGGSNGKTMIMNALMEILPDLIKKIDTKLFEENFTKTHKFIPKLRNCRIAFFEEFPNNKKINIDMYKEIADGNTISYEVMHGTEKCLKINCKAVINSNYTPEFPNMDDPIVRRYIHCQFNSKFSVENKVDDFDNLQFILDTEMKNKLIESPMTLLSVFLEYAHNFAKTENMYDTPEEFNQEKDDVIENNSTFYTWLCSKVNFNKDLACPKKEIQYFYQKENDIKISDKELRDILKSKGFKYERKGKRVRKNQGIFTGFDWKDDVLHNDSDDI